jgi:mannosylglycerate hydrolase
MTPESSLLSDKTLSKKRDSNPAKNNIKCHFISNTHWDREWRFSMQRTRYMLVYMMDMLLDTLEKYPDFSSFHLDSQTIPILDYLEIRPEKEHTIRKMVQNKRLFIGPWFCLPDEFCVSGESIIRNLLLGHKIAAKFGGVSKSGYSPFSWGQISQMPQIYKGFGIDFTAFYRGINTLVAPKSEIIWQGPDGSRLVCSRLGKRPRYNVWYVIQRPVYWNQRNVSERVVNWDSGGAFKIIDSEGNFLDALYTHPPFNYHKENIAEFARQAIEEQNEDWSTPHRFWSCGHDSSCPDMREIQMIRDCNEALGDGIDVFHSNFMDFQQQVSRNIPENAPVVKGEMRHYFTEGSTSVLYGWIISARMDIKQDNFKTENHLTNLAEPLAVYASLLGADFPGGFLDEAYRWLLQNHGHDSIGGCSRDIISQDMLFRSRQTREIAACITETSLAKIAGSIDYSDLIGREIVPILAYNPTDFARREVVKAYIQVPDAWQSEGITITDSHGNNVDFQLCGTESPFYQIVQSPNDTANMFRMKRYEALIDVRNVPANGYSSLFVKPVKQQSRPRRKTMLSGEHTMENEHLRVTINSNGTLDLLYKNTQRLYKGLGYFRDSSEIGNPWEHKNVANEQVFTTLDQNARISLVSDGELEACFKAVIDWSLPAARTPDDKFRSEFFRPYVITNYYTLRKGCNYIEIRTELDNNVEDHYLQVCFPTGLNTDSVHAQGQFDVIERQIKLPDPAIFDEDIQTEQPMNNFVDISDGENGFALLNEGLKAYEAQDNLQRNLNLTLLRCFPMRICVTEEMIDYSRVDCGSQCLGRHSFRYAVMPHSGNWNNGGVWEASETFVRPLRICQIAPSKYGTEPMNKSFIEIEPQGLHIIAVKRSEAGDGWVVRLFNRLDKSVSGRIRFNGGKQASECESPVNQLQNEFSLAGTSDKIWSKAVQVTLEELPEKELEIDPDGWVHVALSGKKILTIMFKSEV